VEEAINLNDANHKKLGLGQDSELAMCLLGAANEDVKNLNLDKILT
jgi:hypothetical protein